jgi:hypothetical protein
MFMETDLFQVVLMAGLIISARVCDVTQGNLRTEPRFTPIDDFGDSG